MPIAGLHNISVLDSSFLRDSHSQGSIQHLDGGRGSSRASSILQMWREIEDDQSVRCAQDGVSEVLHPQRNDESVADLSNSDVSEIQSEHRFGSEDASLESKGDGSISPSQIGSHDESNSFICEHSSDFGQVERERVRQIVREWMDSGPREHPSNGLPVNSSSRVEWMGEVEQERVRLIRQWVQIRNFQQRGACGEREEHQTAEIGSQIDHVLDGSVVNMSVGKTEHSWRGVRKLCGRQALLDMLKKAERERQRELQGLLAQRAVSHFAHRNRIQSLLRGRFLRNERMTEDNRPPSSIAASELGLLREMHTVTGPREGFLSRIDHSASGQVVSRDPVDTSSNSDINDNRNDQTEAHNLLDLTDGFHEQSGYINQNHDIHGVSDGRNDLGENIVEHIGWQEASAHAEEQPQQVFQDEVREWQRLTRASSASEWTIETYQNEDMEQSDLQEVVEVFDDQPEPRFDESAVSEFSDRTDDLEGNDTSDLANWQESVTQVERMTEHFFVNHQINAQGAGIEPYQQRNSTMEDMLRNLQESAVNEWSQELLGTEDRVVGGNTQENSEVWNEDGEFQEAMQNWLEEPSDEEVIPVGRVDITYPPADDTVYSMEIRELLNRRRVSNLLHSGFRENLDQLIQSYVQRQSDATMEWEMHGTSLSGASASQDLAQQSGYPNEGQEVTLEISPLPLPPPPLPPNRSIWEQDSQPDNWPPNDMHQHLGIEVINDLRIDMARLQQRMNNMQRTLEACMDMQLELQLSIRQEVFAALNRSADSPGVTECGLLVDKYKWDNIRKGICCLCCDSNIDSLLYRCGHMCTCSKCANGLIETRGKCPMCQAPVVEVVRAFSIT